VYIKCKNKEYRYFGLSSLARRFSQFCSLPEKMLSLPIKISALTKDLDIPEPWSGAYCYLETQGGKEMGLARDDTAHGIAIVEYCSTTKRQRFSPR
jgi:hypothetical protein